MSQARFISEAIRPVPSTFNTGRMAAGGAGLPRQFAWRDQTLEIDAVLREWRETSPCRHGSGEQYVRKHCFEVRLTTGAVAQLYFERQARARSQTTQRWWLFSLAAAPAADAPTEVGDAGPDATK